ncbi:unnamed protein product [Spirodela intermedia]|uniref:Uncharacterized protein n=1 Tax=Spirodela intermedia TaxID=51605 RepID=A0A7I8L208_SPIIN|nr:unnamed protein product [Spirodela intermedia]
MAGHAPDSADDENREVFDMISLSAHLPRKRNGLSLHFSGKSRSFTSIAEAKSVGDLKKPEIPEAKRRKYVDREARILSLVPCRAAPSASHCSPCVGV